MSNVELLVREARTLPPEYVEQALNFIAFLKTRPTVGPDKSSSAKPAPSLRSMRGIDKGRDTLPKTPSLLSMIGIDKDRDNMEAYFKRHHADNDREREQERKARADRGY